jgi:Ca2+-binding EF-hand superfamily protein
MLIILLFCIYEDKILIGAIFRHLESKVSDLIKEIDAEIKQVDEKLGQSFNVIDKNKDGMIDR